MRYADPKLTPETIKSLTFISAKLANNPALMRNDPGYLGNLMLLPQVERRAAAAGQLADPAVSWALLPAALGEDGGHRAADGRLGAWLGSGSDAGNRRERSRLDLQR